MHEFRWLDHLPGGTIAGGVALANRLYWNITFSESEQSWYVWGGEKLLLRSDSWEVAEAFLYGLGLAYAIFPDGLFEQLEHHVKRLVAPEDVDNGPSSAELNV